MSPAIRVPVIRATGTPGKPKPKKPNAVRRIMEREESRERRVRERSATVSSAANGSGALATEARRLQCPNRCNNPKVQNGTCHNCGAVAQEMDIVADITFGEAANGAAVVQGNYLAADQGAIRSAGGYAFRRGPGSGSEARERSIREVKGLLQQWTHQLQISMSLVESALRNYRMASNSNFVQGRRKNNVAAICLYAVCRKEASNRVMLIDLADIVKTDVFLLGRDYKNLLAQFPSISEGTKPIILEDLIYRFATKLEFYHDTNKVAESAVRIAARMRRDNITHGRRPAGICGAAIIMAARAHNYRRTVREVVYIAKVTMATLQERMEEFANVPSAQMTISEFHEQDFLESNHDPPFVYKQTKEWKEKHGGGRKRKAKDISREAAAPVNGAPAVPGRAGSSQPGATPISSAPTIDKDGFVIPPLPQRLEPVSEATGANSEVAAIASAATGDGDDENQLEVLASEYGDSDDEDSEIDPSSEMAMAAAQGIITLPRKKGGRSGAKTPTNSAGGAANEESAAGEGPPKKKKRTLVIDEDWEMDEANLEQEMVGHLNDPAMIGASAVVTKDVEARRAQEPADENPAHTPTPTPSAAPGLDEGSAGAEETSVAEVPAPVSGYASRSKVSDDPIVHEDEFKDDPEVMFCRLGEEEVKIKEMIWANHNKDYMRQVQQKIFDSKMSEGNPPKQRRNRTKKPRIGEGQASPAQSAEEAAVNMMRNRGISTKLDYSRLGAVFDLSKRGPGSTYGGTSSVGSHSGLPSAAGSPDDGGAESDEEEDGPSRNAAQGSARATDAVTAAPSTAQSTTAASATTAGDVAANADETEMEEDDYEGPSEAYNEHNEYEGETYMEEDINPFEGSERGGYDSDEE